MRSFRQLSTTTYNSTNGLCGPAVRLLMLQYGINKNDVKPTGPKRNILKSDILNLVEISGLKPLSVNIKDPPPKNEVSKAYTKPIKSNYKTSEYVDLPLTNIRATTAKRMTLSKQTIPHEYVSTTVQADALLILRKNLKKEGTTLSLNDFVVKATALALRAVPAINVQWSPEKESIISLPTVDISIAVATPTGLITPIVTGADVLGVREISYRIKDLSNRARENKLQPYEFQGGSFTISNLGMFGSVDNFTAIINPPQAAILTIGRSRVEINNQMKPETRFTSTLCFDARAISALSARAFIEHFSFLMSDPDFMITELENSRLDFDIARLL